MGSDYYSMCYAQMENIFYQLVTLVEKIEQAKKTRNTSDRDKFNKELINHTRSCVEIEPHFSYLHFMALKERTNESARNTSANKKRQVEDEAKQYAEIANGIRNAWREKLESISIPKYLSCLPDVSALETLPSLSFILSIPFHLIKPYISKDENEFYILDNSIRKDKVFKVPMVAATGWKGALRAALWQLGQKEDNEMIIRLFGNPRESEEGRSGRLYFYPTFFDKISLEVINPHNRETGAGARGPILMECVPARTSGTFTLLYVPFDLIGKEEQEVHKQVASDLELLIKGIQAMFVTYGFGAKTSSGFGTAEMANEGGTILLNFTDAKESKPKPTEPQEPESIQQFKQEFQGEDFSMKPKEWAKEHSSSKKDQYIKVKEEYRKYRDELNSYPSRLKQWEESEQAPASPVTPRTFSDWKKLNDVVDEISGALKNGAST